MQGVAYGQSTAGRCGVATRVDRRHDAPLGVHDNGMWRDAPIVVCKANEEPNKHSPDDVIVFPAAREDVTLREDTAAVVDDAEVSFEHSFTIPS